MQSSSENGLVRPGMELGGKYRLVSELGRGAMGTVWIGEHMTLNQRVAIKVISPEHAGSEELRQRFEREAKAAAKLTSRYVVTVFDHGTSPEGLPYLVMELLQGESLEDRIARLGTLPLTDVVRITRHVARGLAKAHERGIVHRDLKPANIFITRSEDEDEEWVAKILDFGIAKMEDYGDRSATKTGTVLGTPLFMSPEQVRGSSKVDGRADLYSLGMVVFNMFTGSFAFEGQSFGDLLVSICTDELPVLSERAPAAPGSLDVWFRKTCARDAADRYQTADDLLAAFNDALGNSFPVSRQSVTDSTATAPQFPALHRALVETQKRENAPLPRKPSNERAELASASPATLTLAEVAIPKNSPSKGLLLGAAAIVLLGAAYATFSSGLLGGESANPGPTQLPATGASSPSPSAEEAGRGETKPGTATPVASASGSPAAATPPPSQEVPPPNSPSASSEATAVSGGKPGKPVASKPASPVPAPQSVPSPSPAPAAPSPAKRPGPRQDDVGF